MLQNGQNHQSWKGERLSDAPKCALEPVPESQELGSQLFRISEIFRISQNF